LGPRSGPFQIESWSRHVDTDSLLLLIVALTALAAAFFTVVPVLPGSLFVLAGAAVCALVDGWDQFSAWFWVAQGVLVALGVAIDQVAQLVGVKRAGGSRQAMWGGAIGVFAGPFVLAFVIGPFALLLGPPIGAVVGTLLGEEYARSRAGHAPGEARDYHRLGTVALVAFAVGTGCKLVLVAIQVAILFAVVR
jgi:uncharacterized protein YqgC (DUF456 family)